MTSNLEMSGYEAIRKVASLWDRAMQYDDLITDAYDTIAACVPAHRRYSLTQAVEAMTDLSSSLRREADALMQQYGITHDEMNDHYNTRAEIAVAHYDPTPMLPSMATVRAHADRASSNLEG